MATLVLNAYSKPYPSITNRIMASLRYQTSPLAIVVSDIQLAPHPERTWNFSGLPRNNYIFSLDEIDGGGAVVSNLAFFAVVPGQVDGLLTRGDEQIQVNTTPGFNGGDNTFTFDGTDGKPDYIGWQITPSEIAGGRGILVRGVDYSWDSTTGTLVLLQALDEFAADNYWNIHFDPIQSSQGNSYPTLSDFSIRLITTDDNLLAADFGNKVIVEPGANYIEVTLPDIDTVVEGRPLKIEIGGTGIKSVRFLPFGSNTINFLDGNLIGMCNESFTIYKFIRPSTDKEWRVCDAEGNFKTVGNIVETDTETVDFYNGQMFDGSIVDKDQYARIFEWILKLPLSQVVAFADWTTGSNYLKFSLLNGSNEFRFPDRSKMYYRASNGVLSVAGDYQGNQVGEFTMPLPEQAGLSDNANDRNVMVPGLTNIVVNSGKETRPETVVINKYVLL